MNKKKAFIFGELNFPGGSASANYVQYLAYCLRDIGYEVYVLSNINEDEGVKYISDSVCKYNGLYVVKINVDASNGIARHIKKNYLRGKVVVKQIEKICLNKNDLVISYSMNECEMNTVFSYAKKKKAVTCACITELLSEKQFGKGKRDIYYWRYLYGVNKVIPKADYVFPISTYIEDYYKKRNIKSKIIRVPILADIKYPFEKKEKAITKFIFPANGMMKDSLHLMLSAFISLPKEFLAKTEFHITGVSEKYINQYADSSVRKELGKHIIVHGWLTYKELEKLYREVHYLLLIREINQMTLANFPSKVPEVMGYGVVPVVSRVGDYTAVFLENNYDSIFIETLDKTHIMSILEDAILKSESEYLQLSQNSYESVKDKLDYKKWCAVFEKLFC